MGSSKYDIRQAEEKDLECLLDIRFQFACLEQEFVPGLLVERSGKKWKDSQREETVKAIKIGNPLYVLAWEEDELLGYVNVFHYPDFRNKFFIGELFVIKQKRGSGIAKELYKYVAKQAKNRKKGVLHVTVSSRNKRALAFFKKMGFKKIRSKFVNLEVEID